MYSDSSGTRHPLRETERDRERPREAERGRERPRETEKDRERFWEMPGEIGRESCVWDVKVLHSAVDRRAARLLYITIHFCGAQPNVMGSDRVRRGAMWNERVARKRRRGVYLFTLSLHNVLREWFGYTCRQIIHAAIFCRELQ